MLLLDPMELIAVMVVVKSASDILQDVAKDER
jgi:hypothetical protein